MFNSNLAKRRFIVAFWCNLFLIELCVFGQQSRHEQYSKIASGFANPISGERRIDDALPFAITFAKADESPSIRAIGMDAVRWHFSEDRVLQALGIQDPTPAIKKLAKTLGGVLTIESIIRTIEVYGFDDLSPEVSQFFKHEPDVVKPYVAATQYIVNAVEANEPTAGDVWLATMEFEQLSFTEQMVDAVVSGALTAARERGIKTLIVHEFRKVVSSVRRDAWKEIRRALLEVGDSKPAEPSDFAFSIPIGPGKEQSNVLVRNASARALRNVTIVIENQEDIAITGQHIHTWNAMQAYYIALPMSHRLPNSAPLTAKKQRSTTPFRVTVVDSTGVILDSYLTQSPGTRQSILHANAEEIILESAPIFLSPNAMSKALRASTLEYNKSISSTVSSLRSQQRRIAKTKNRLTQDQQDLLDGDIVRLDEGKLPKSLFPWVANDLIDRNEVFVSHLKRLESLAKMLGYTAVEAEIQSCLQIADTEKLLLPIPIPNEVSDADTSRAALRARSNLELLIQLVETRLNAIEKRLLTRARRSKSDQDATDAMYKIGELRFEYKLPIETPESDVAYLKDLAVKFHDGLRRLEASLDATDKSGRYAVDEVLSEFQRRYGWLRKNE